MNFRYLRLNIRNKLCPMIGQWMNKLLDTSNDWAVIAKTVFKIFKGMKNILMIPSLVARKGYKLI